MTSPLFKAASEPDLIVLQDLCLTDSDDSKQNEQSAEASSSRALEGGESSNGVELTNFGGDGPQPTTQGGPSNSELPRSSGFRGAVSFYQYIQGESDAILGESRALRFSASPVSKNGIHPRSSLHPDVASTTLTQPLPQSTSSPVLLHPTEDLSAELFAAWSGTAPAAKIFGASSLDDDLLANLSSVDGPRRNGPPKASASTCAPPPGDNEQPSATDEITSYPTLKSNSIPSPQMDEEIRENMRIVHEPHDAVKTALGEKASDTTTRPSFAARRYELSCYEIDVHGNVSQRMLTRSEILQEARETLPKHAPSPKAVARWLDKPEIESQELKDFSAVYVGRREASRKAMQRALRNYLRNSLQPRDIRQVDPAFAAKPALWVRNSAMVVSLEGVRAIILHNKIFLFDPDHPLMRTTVSVVQQSIKTSPDLLEDPAMPFEFKALEGIFIVGILGLEREFNQFDPDISKKLRELPSQLTTKMLEDLRANKQRLNHFLSRAHSVRDILEKLLEEDEDMANMYLTEKSRSPNVSRNVMDHDEVEMLLEAYMQVIDELVNRADLLSDAIEDLEDLVMIHLDTLRNRLLSVELAMSVVSMTFGFGGVVGGVFGMNLQITLFESSASKFWFLGVVLFIIFVVVAVSWILLIALRRRGLYTPEIRASIFGLLRSGEPMETVPS